MEISGTQPEESRSRAGIDRDEVVPGAVPLPLPEEKMPLAWRLRLILGASLALWALIILVLLWALGIIG